MAEKYEIKRDHFESDKFIFGSVEKVDFTIGRVRSKIFNDEFKSDELIGTNFLGYAHIPNLT